MEVDNLIGHSELWAIILSRLTKDISGRLKNRQQLSVLQQLQILYSI